MGVSSAVHALTDAMAAVSLTRDPEKVHGPWPRARLEMLDCHLDSGGRALVRSLEGMGRPGFTRGMRTARKAVSATMDGS